MNTEDLARRTVILKDELSNDEIQNLDWSISIFSNGSIPEFKFVGEHVYKAPTSEGAYLWLGFLMFWASLMAVQEWPAFSVIIRSGLIALALTFSAYLGFLYLRKKHFDFDLRVYEKHTLGVFGCQHYQIQFENIKALQLIKVDKNFSNDIDEHYEMFLVRTDNSRVPIANMLNRFYFLVAALNIHERSNIPLWMNKY